jgi:hypothetical protein
MKKAKDPITKCFRCGKDISKLSEDKVFDHMTIHNRDDIIAEYPELIEIDLEIHKKYGAEIKILFE